MTEPIISAEWLNNNLNNPNLIILDASQQTNKSGISSQFDQIQIIGARTLDLKGEFSLKGSNLPNMLPQPTQFEQACENIGINRSSEIIVYDNLGVYFSPRVWWMFKTMGHDKISVLNGGLPDWINSGFKTEAKKSIEFKAGDFCSSYRADAVKTFEFIKANINKQEYILIDARPSDRFNGIAPEPRKGLGSGNIPNSINLPFKDVLKNGKYKSKKELTTLFANLPIDNRPLIFSCGSGVTACIVLLAFELVFENKKSVYDGSWTEWAERIKESPKL